MKKIQRSSKAEFTPSKSNIRLGKAYYFLIRTNKVLSVASICSCQSRQLSSMTKDIVQIPDQQLYTNKYLECISSFLDSPIGLNRKEIASKVIFQIIVTMVPSLCFGSCQVRYKQA